jgi:hypothetical protein
MRRRNVNQSSVTGIVRLVSERGDHCENLPRKLLEQRRVIPDESGSPQHWSQIVEEAESGK